MDQCYDEMVELAVGSIGYHDHGFEELPLLGFVAEVAGDLEEPQNAVVDGLDVVFVLSKPNALKYGISGSIKLPKSELQCP